MKPNAAPQALDIETIKRNAFKPKRAVVTAGMVYANGPVHLGHISSCHIPADICARWLRMLIGHENVLFVTGSDDHGSASEVAAIQAGRSTKDFIASIHAQHKATMERYNISVNAYPGTSRDDCYPIHKEVCQDFIRQNFHNGMLEKKVSKQWFDPKLKRFLQDRFVRGKCPNAKCENEAAYSDECDRCGAQYDPTELSHPKSAVSDATPELRDTVHWWLDMWKVLDPLRQWALSKEKTWRHGTYLEVVNTVVAAAKFDNTSEEKYKEIKNLLPKHKSKYAAGKKIVVQFDSIAELSQGQHILLEHGVKSELVNGWAHRSISRDVAWGIPMPEDLDPEMAGKTFYVWPDSLIAPISFSKVALRDSGRDPELSDQFWKDPEARIYQFLGQDNVYFYTLMQGALWLGHQQSPLHLPKKGDYTMTDVYSAFHLMVEGEKMSKSRGNFYTADQLILEKGYSADQVRYFLALLSLPEKSSNFDFGMLAERNKFLAGPMNAAFEKPISACHSKFDGSIPNGSINPKVQDESLKMIQKYLRSMERAEYSTLLYSIENYARSINSMFTQFKPHDDRFPEDQRRDALYTCFYVLKNIMIMLYPFVPSTMDKVRQAMNLPESVFCIEELGKPLPAGHRIDQKQEFFPAVPE
jgi:methionyl-tRNA synthetase